MECGRELKDIEFANGAFLKYEIENGIVKVHWGNHEMSRTLGESFDCSGRPNAIPWIDKASSKYIIMRYSCGSPCWGIFILPLAKKDSVMTFMYDVNIDLVNEQIVYVDNKSYNSLTIEDLNTHAKQEVKSTIDCRAAFLGFCIDSVKLANNQLYIKWIDWKDKQKVEVVDVVDVKL